MAESTDPFDLETLREPQLKGEALTANVKHLQAALLRTFAEGGEQAMAWPARDAKALLAGADALEQLQATRDHHAALEAHTAELHELLAWSQSGEPTTGDEWDRNTIRIHAVLQTPPPAAGRAILAEVTRLRKVRDALRKVGDRPYDTEAAADLESALEELDTLDQSAPQEPTDG